MFKQILAASAAWAVMASGVSAQSTPFEASYDASIPTLESFAGHDFSEEITRSGTAVDYLRALAEAAPDRMRVFDYAQSWQGRDLVYAVIASPEHMAEMDQIQANIQRMADPRGLTADEREALIQDMPAVVWLSYAVHGDEVTTTSAGILSAYHLLAAENDPMVETILENTIVIVDPVQNPDGRDRFITNFEESRGLEFDDDRYSAEHDQPWPGGRLNHYLFDMNRDWFAMTQPESRGRVAAMLDWYPLAVIDVHEMGGDASYFFAPSAEPFNPNIAESQREAQYVIGRNHARWFDQFGYDYFTREIFDAFYPGYGDMWPTLQGSIAMTYEQGSPRGLAFRKRDGTVLTYEHGVNTHTVASLSTAEAVANNRELFVRNFIEYRASGGGENGADEAMLLDTASNPWNAHRMARNLAAQGIEVTEISGRFDACGASFEDGAYLVRYDQPAGRLARTLLEPTTNLPEDFIEEQERRRDDGLGHELYDVTAWALPLMANVDAVSCRRAPAQGGSSVDADSPLPPGGGSGDASYGYVIPWTDAGQARLVGALAREGVSLRTTSEAFTIGDRTYPRGSVVAPRHGSAADFDFTIERLARESGAVVDGLANSWVDTGPNPGSGSYSPIRAPRIAMIWGDGTSPLSAGPTRYVLERRYGLPVSVIRVRTASYADLSRYDVLIIPEPRGTYSGLDAATSNIQRFVRDGGVVVGIGSATRWLADSDVNLIPAQRERAADTPRGAASEGSVVDGVILADEADQREAEAATGAMPDSSPGALVRIEANSNAWMSAGYETGGTALATGRDIYAPIAMDDATTALRFGDHEDLLEGGYLWEEYAEQLARKPFVVTNSVGDGQVVAFTQSPTTRAYLDGLDLLLLNAVLLGPAQSRALR